MEKERKVKDDTDKINAIYQTIPTKIVIDYIYNKYACFVRHCVLNTQMKEKDFVVE